MPPKYEHTQRPGIPFYSCIVIALVLGLMGVPGLFTIILLAWVLLMMSSLTVTIDDQFLRVRFGPGVFFKKFLLSEIAECGPKYKIFCFGWGIRWYFTGWLYNVAGFKSVEIRFKNGKKARIGTDEPEKLAGAIHEAIKANKTAV